MGIRWKLQSKSMQGLDGASPFRLKFLKGKLLKWQLFAFREHGRQSEMCWRSGRLSSGGVEEGLTDILALEQELIIFLKSDLRFKLWVIVISFTAHKFVTVSTLQRLFRDEQFHKSHLSRASVCPFQIMFPVIETTFQELTDMKPTK